MLKYFLLLIFGAILTLSVKAQNKQYKIIPLPAGINGVNEEFSGLAHWQDRVYLLPQYGSHKENKLDGDFNIYSVQADSIARVIDKRDSALSACKTIKILNMDKLPDSVKRYYQGFEAISIVDGRVFLSMETIDTHNYCFLLKGTIDTSGNRIYIDTINIISLKRPLYVKNAGFEALTYLPKQNKFLATYEFNATTDCKTSYLIDTAFANNAQAVGSPFQYFRIADMVTGADDKIYAINYHYSGDYQSYLNNSTVKQAEQDIRQRMPTLRDSIDHDPEYLKKFNYAAIVKLDAYDSKRWKPIITFEGLNNNWEGLILFKKGVLIITDANRSNKQNSILAYLEF
jgi:hypothetical protein